MAGGALEKGQDEIKTCKEFINKGVKMKYHIDTIPVWDAMKEDTECLLCSIEKKQEDKYVSFYLGDSVMQPEVRQRTNKTGFCGKHYEMMYAQTKKLPLGLRNNFV